MPVDPVERERLKERARLMYAGGRLASLSQVAAEVGVNLSTLKRWARDGAWFEPAPGAGVTVPDVDAVMAAIGTPAEVPADLLTRTLQSIRFAIDDPRTRLADRIAAVEFLESRERAASQVNAELPDLSNASEADLDALEAALARATGEPMPAGMSPEQQALFERAFEDREGSIGWLRREVERLTGEVERLRLLALEPEAAIARMAAQRDEAIADRDAAVAAESEARKAALALADRTA